MLFNGNNKGLMIFLSLFGCVILNSCHEDNMEDLNPGNHSTIADHTVAREIVLRSIPQEYIDKARTTLHIAYQHTSHGTHVSRGLFGLPDYRAGDDVLFGSPYADPGEEAADLSSNETAFIQATRNFLGDDANQNINVVMWSWCDIAGHQVATNYLPGMDALISEYGAGGSKIGTGAGKRPNPVTFVFMTGHANQGSNTGDGNPKNQAALILEHCQKYGYLCLDYYSIDTHDMDGN